MRSRLSPSVRRLGYTGSPVPVDEWLKLRETILSSHPEAMSGRMNFPPAIVCCVQCSAEVVKPGFVMTKHAARGLTEFFCSNRCWALRQNLKAHGVAVKLCFECGGEAPRGARFGSPKAPFCSETCMAANRAKRKAATRERQPWLVCPECETRFQTSVGLQNYRAKRGGGTATFCGRACADRRHARKMSGMENPGWRHGLAPARMQPHAAKAFREVRREILQRDSGACAVCASPARPHVHHINLNPLDNRWRNLIVMCPACHRALHANERSSSPERATLFSELTKFLSRTAELRSSTFRSPEITTSSPTA